MSVNTSSTLFIGVFGGFTNVGWVTQKSFEKATTLNGNEYCSLVDTKNVEWIDSIIDNRHAFDGFVICRRKRKDQTWMSMQHINGVHFFMKIINTCIIATDAILKHEL